MKHFLVLLIASLVTCSTHAQFRPDRRPDVGFGLKAGVSVSNMNLNKGYPAPAENIEPSWKTGFVLGFVMDVPVYGNLRLQPEYLYLQTNGENTANGAAYSFSYLSLPVLFKYPLLGRVSLMAGPQFDLLIKADERLDGNNSVITHDTEERSIAAVAGMDFSLNSLLSLNARYLHGFNHIGLGQRSNVTEFKFETIQVSALLKF
ncbi:porin family protein [Paradesertivirga mongoliensis]|uniref:Porin family protein n=1 Tax=Paradesertivirga mongoliensis TaxID=2100740 RepID=A0ABW4ZMX0_9SPHI|nr:porin family protein [Pedobacter mongoliensis]